MPELDVDVWVWLRQCLDCGEVHQWRWTCPHDHEHGSAGSKRCEGGTWAAEDGHVYRRRVLNIDIDKLQREYEAKQ